jgi:hypothetical protein
VIRLLNTNEFLIEWIKQPVIAAGNPTALTNGLSGYQPTASKILDAMNMPCDGLIRAFVFVINTVGAAGNSVDLKAAYRLRNGDYDLSGTTQLTADGLAIDLTQSPTFIPVAGTRIICPAISGAPQVKIGQQVHLFYTESGTAGTATRPIINPVGIIIRAGASIDPRDIAYNR